MDHMNEPCVTKPGRQLFITVVCSGSPQCLMLITELCPFMHMPTLAVMQRAYLFTQVHMELTQGASAKYMHLNHS